MPLGDGDNRRRGWEIVCVLAKHGPLSMPALTKLLSTPMKSKKVYAALMRLQKKGMVDRRVSNLGMGAAFYQLSLPFISQPGLKETLDCNPDELKRLRNIRGCLHLREMKELWIFTLSKVLPVVEVVQKEFFSVHPETNRLLRLNGNPILHAPDAVIYFLGPHKKKLAVALEIEKTRPSDERIIQYLKRYAKSTELNGVIYVCDSGRLSETIRLLYETMQEDRRLREAGNLKNFFLFSNAISHSDAPLSQLHTVIGNPTSISNWYSRFEPPQPTISSDQFLN